MTVVNENYLKLPGSYLFAEIARRVKAFKDKNPSADIISLGIGDVTQPLAPVVIKALHKAVDEMADAELAAMDRLVGSLEAEPHAVAGDPRPLEEAVMLEPLQRALLDARAAFRDDPDPAFEALDQCRDDVEHAVVRRGVEGVIERAADERGVG